MKEIEYYANHYNEAHNHVGLILRAEQSVQSKSYFDFCAKNSKKCPGKSRKK